MNQQNSQAVTLGILLWVYSAIQSIFALIILLVILLYGFSGVMMLMQGDSDAAVGLVFMVVIIVIYILLFAIGVASIFLNIKAGNQLRKSEPASKNLVLASTIGNFISFLCGGICLAPFGIGMGIFGLVFIFSENGKLYFQGLSNSYMNTTPPPYESYYDQSGNLINKR